MGPLSSGTFLTSLPDLAFHNNLALHNPVCHANASANAKSNAKVKANSNGNAHASASSNANVHAHVPQVLLIESARRIPLWTKAQKALSSQDGMLLFHA